MMKEAEKALSKIPANYFVVVCASDDMTYCKLQPNGDGKHKLSNVLSIAKINLVPEQPAISLPHVIPLSQTAKLKGNNQNHSWVRSEHSSTANTLRTL